MSAAVTHNNGLTEWGTGGEKYILSQYFAEFSKTFPLDYLVYISLKYVYFHNNFCNAIL
jgi:hypothetical protein